MTLSSLSDLLPPSIFPLLIQVQEGAAPAAASGAGSPEAGGGFNFFDPILLMLLGIFALMYFLTIRPQQKRAKAHRELISSIKEGDEVVTSGGIVGRITQVDENVVTLTSGESSFKLQRSAVVAALPHGTLS
ncbi:MAG: preprotein translocase subunit YajC [Gammaproteobacteria bacterium AqS3]|nr:preprotein translocase subunit YajC [Gammaproteobacteria bacterium AqS3]